MPTYHVQCAECGGDKWPMLPSRPERYVCVLCLSVTSEQRVKRREAGQRMTQTKKSRQRGSGEATGGAA